jgi:hypothetical protein
VHAARADDGLDEDGGHALGPDPLQLGLERLERVVRDVRRVGVQRAHAFAVGRDAPDARAQAMRAVVALGAADEVHPPRLAGGGEEAAGELRGGVDGVAAARAEEDAGIVERGEAGQALGERQRGLVGERPECRVAGQLLHLRGRRLDDLAPAVARVDAPQAGRGVEVARAARVPHRCALAAHDDELGAAHGVHVGERVPQARVGAHDLTLPPLTGTSRPRRGRSEPRRRRDRR